MVIAIDVGNSAIKVARVTGDVVADVTRIPSSPLDPEALRAVIGDAPDGDAPEVALVSVVPAWTAAIHRLCVARGTRAIEADADSIPITVALPDPGRVGSDRLLGAWTSRETWGAPVIVIDCGTATTIDVVDGAGSFVGGAILPGAVLGIRSLAADTVLLPAVAPRLPVHAIGRDTVEAIQSGAVLGHAAAIEGLLARIIDELGAAQRPTVALTGGGAATPGSIEGVDQIDGNLLLRGLGLLAERLAVAP
jgi:type III pantothenate kinase